MQHIHRLYERFRAPLTESICEIIKNVKRRFIYWSILFTRTLDELMIPSLLSTPNNPSK